ncbi:LCP family protein [Sedimentibacter hydroxybenzoicus DSM 7310]|uniref:LCP family protein n=1 Tax=Sedimentibacter hydroxybenzoicus DSM 7310 TaxID=1123245 RepID=A0A974BJC8_SEDHY|nr:LCP family protein [Sedimentibacter hydroxybenzoicus]NYB73715.1 LCP family protein [Sedimentibacter hydroxybenzoicus DSM 7310]
MIKHFFKIFFASVIFLTVVLSVTALGYIVFVDKDMVIGKIQIRETNKTISTSSIYESSTFDYSTTVGKLAKNSKRFNVLVVGLEHMRTDTIMVASYDTESKDADLISVPRDTYYPRNTDDEAEFKKINAVYSQEGIESLTASVQKLLGIPIDKYVIIDYEAVISCVDKLGGVEVDVPFHMVYSDPYDKPPLYIDIPEGRQLLDGEQSLKFLRYRKGYSNQDLGRIEAQQQFIKSAAKKALGFELPSLIREAYSYIDTNLNVTDLVSLAGSLIGFSTDNISMHTLPGKEAPLEGLSFYLPDNEDIAEMVLNMYSTTENKPQNN